MTTGRRAVPPVPTWPGCELIFVPGNTVGLRAVLDSTRDLPLVTVINDSIRSACVRTA